MIEDTHYIHPVDKTVGLRIRQARHEKGLSQQALADAICKGLSFQQVQKYERAANRVSASTLWEIAGALGVPVSYFYEGLPDKPDHETPQARKLREYTATPEARRLLTYAADATEGAVAAVTAVLRESVVAVEAARQLAAA
jgi:transcriptional regulator with XRE-family HTH domain